MTIPNLGVTQIIPQQGPLGIAAQGLGGLGQLMMQVEQAKQEKAKNDAYNAYMTELKNASEAERQRRAAADAAEAKNAQTMGGALRDYLTPAQQQVNISSIGGAFGVPSLPAQVNIERERTMQEVMANLPPELVADFAKQVAPVEQTRQQKAEAVKAKRGMESYLKTLPPSMREPMRAIVQLESAGVPANLSQFIVSGLVQEGAKDPKAIAAMRQKYPELAALPDAEVMQMGTELMLGQMRIRLGIVPNPNAPRSGSVGGRDPESGMTPQQKQYYQLLLLRAKRAETAAKAAGTRPKDLQPTVPGTEFIPTSDRQVAQLGQYLTDSTSAAGRRDQAVDDADRFAVNVLTQSLGIPTVEAAGDLNQMLSEESQQVAAAHAWVRDHPTMSNAEKTQRHRAIDEAFKARVAAMRAQP